MLPLASLPPATAAHWRSQSLDCRPRRRSRYVQLAVKRRSFGAKRLELLAWLPNEAAIAADTSSWAAGTTVVVDAAAAAWASLIVDPR